MTEEAAPLEKLKKLKMSDKDIEHIKSILEKYSSGPMKSLDSNADPITLEWMREFSDRSFAILKKLDDVLKALDDLDSVKFAICEEDAATVNAAKQQIRDASSKLDAMKILEAAPFPDLGTMNSKLAMTNLDKMDPEKLGAHLIELGKRIDQAYASDVIAELPFWQRVSIKFGQIMSKSKK